VSNSTPADAAGRAIVIDLESVDMEMLATALADQGGWEHRWLFDSRTGETSFWSSDDSADEAESDDDDPEHGRLRVEPLPSWVWYQDMVDFAEQTSDEQTGRRLGRALDGKGAFRRFKNQLHQEYPDLLPAWNAFSGNRAVVRAVEWLYDNDLLTYERYQQYRAEHPDTPLP
jgi:hypothetical protein